MTLRHRKIDFPRDRAYVLERHCRINYECDAPWKRKMPYDAYQAEWFGLSGQIDEFSSALLDSIRDTATIAEIIESEDGTAVGYLWVPFSRNEESGFCFAKVQDIYVEPAYRGMGIAAQLMMLYAEENARQNGAKILRSGTGCENDKSIGLYQKLGYYTYRYEFEKLL